MKKNNEVFIKWFPLANAQWDGQGYLFEKFLVIEKNVKLIVKKCFCCSIFVCMRWLYILIRKLNSPISLTFRKLLTFWCFQLVKNGNIYQKLIKNIGGIANTNISENWLTLNCFLEGDWERFYTILPFYLGPCHTSVVELFCENDG